MGGGGGGGYAACGKIWIQFNGTVPRNIDLYFQVDVLLLLFSFQTVVGKVTTAWNLLYRIISNLNTRYCFLVA